MKSLATLLVSGSGYEVVFAATSADYNLVGITSISDGNGNLFHQLTISFIEKKKSNIKTKMGVNLSMKLIALNRQCNANFRKCQFLQD